MLMKTDTIPAQRLKRGDLELAWRPDPERSPHSPGGYPLVAGYRARGGADYLLARRVISRAHFNTAQAFLDVAQALQGARDGDDDVPVRLPLHQRGHPAEAALEAAERLRIAVDRVGKGPMGIIGAVVLDNATLGNLGVLYGEPEKAMGGRLRAALERLAEVWDEGG